MFCSLGGLRMATRGLGGSAATRFQPVIWLVVASLFIVVVLPSVLRPPPDTANNSAEFSPDAPPEENPEAIIQSLRQAASRTAGGLEQEPEPPPPVKLKPSKVACVGDPPRQVESLYAAPCEPAFKGDNGGATYHGVTRETVKIGITTCSGTVQTSKDGPVPQSPPPASEGPEDSRDRTYRVLQQYFNQNYEFYGRRIQLVSIRPTNDPASGPACSYTGFKAAMAELDDTYKVFGAVTEHPAAQLEGIRRKLEMGGIYGAHPDFYAKNYPYVHSWVMDAGPLVKFGNELLCKQVVDKPAIFAGDESYHTKKRKLGLILFMGEGHETGPDFINGDFTRQCGHKYDEVIILNTYDNQRNQTLATAILTMKQKDVTTVALGLDYLTAGILTHQATQQDYHPEWFVCGCGEIDRNELIELFFDPTQWQHAFGITGAEIARPQEYTDWWRAYKSIDPANDPNESVAKYVFLHLLQFMNGLQRAGPNLTPKTFMDGLATMPRRAPAPKWSIGGGYGPGDYTYSDYVSLIWYDPLAPAPDERGQPGADRHMNGGQRYELGQIPTTPLPWFEDRKEAITGPPPEEL